uniref:G-protein coupled receptors family 2 profile 2 domain-containing protein n=1 Tax=Strigamia maritima TaxID=126957 RepID=T1JAX1_STRMM
MPHGPDSSKHRYRKLAKSTMVLVPLFGVHYMAFLAMSTAAGVDEMTELIWLICDQFFASFQGFFVAVLYCFLNGEVQGEIRKKWNNWYQDHAGNNSEGGRGSFLSQSLNYFGHRSGSTGDRRDRQQCSPSRSPYNQRTTECTSCTTTYYNNPSGSPSPRTERTAESTNWNVCPTFRALSSDCDGSSNPATL